MLVGRWAPRQGSLGLGPLKAAVHSGSACLRAFRVCSSLFLSPLQGFAGARVTATWGVAVPLLRSQDLSWPLLLTPLALGLLDATRHLGWPD